MTADGFLIDSDMVLLYVTAPDMAVARQLAGDAVREKRTACANILPQMIAVYEWDNTIEEGNEVVLLLKTGAAQASELAGWLADRHPYDVPCILEIPVKRGNAPYLEWLASQIAGPRTAK